MLEAIACTQHTLESIAATAADRLQAQEPLSPGPPPPPAVPRQAVVYQLGSVDGNIIRQHQ